MTLNLLICHYFTKLGKIFATAFVYREIAVKFMKKQEISDKKNNILKAIKSGRLAVAFKLLRELSELLMTWEITDEINRLEESYRYMLEYAMRGISDPSRDKVYAGITAGMLSQLDLLERHALTNETPTLYFNTLRYINISSKESIASMLRRYEALHHDYWTTGINLTPDSTVARDNRHRRELLERDIFNRLWTALPLTSEDYESLSAVFTGERYYPYFRQFVLSGLLIGLLEYYDSRRLMLLADAYDGSDDNVSAMAVIATMIALYTHRDRWIDPKVSARLKMLSENPRWHTDLRDAFLELVRARDTERITRTMNEEVVPEIIKMKPEITKRFSGLNNPEGDITDLDMNPEWQEMLDKSGIADKMKKLFELQLEGGDVFMSTFSHLKSFPFFNELSNWFMPFHSDRSELVASQADQVSDIVRILEGVPIFCNSDKYSFVLSIMNIPQAQRDMLRSQLNSQIEGLLEIQNSTEGADTTRKRASIMNRYVQDLYRFFRLFRRKGEFNDPFVQDLNMMTVPAVSNEFNDTDSLLTIAEFYFKHRYYSDALAIFKAIEQMSCPDIQLFEKMGYCYERMRDYSEALKYYEQAELLNADSLWTLRHIALCHRMLKEPSKALSYYKRVVEKETEESVSTAMSIGDCYLEMGNHDKAAKYYYKVNYLDSKHPRARRQLAWTLMMKRDFDKAKQLYDEILADNPTCDDYMNMGHLSLAMSDDNNALNYYKISIVQGGNTIEDFASRLAGDADAFRHMGIEPSIIPLIIDAVSYSEQGQ